MSVGFTEYKSNKEDANKFDRTPRKNDFISGVLTLKHTFGVAKRLVTTAGFLEYKHDTVRLR